MENQVVVSVQGLKKKYGDGDVLKDISFELKKGMTLSVIGPSGSGKSTLLRCLCQLESVSGGSVLVDGDFLVKDGVYAPKSSLRKIGLKVGMVFQKFNLFPHYSVLQNVAEPQVRVKKTPRPEAQKTALEWLSRMNMADRALMYPQQLSGGQQQRVAIARALALSPQVLVFDEPTSALDPELTGEVLKVIKELSAQKMTMIVVTHEMAFARDTSDQMIFIDGGVIVEQGDPAQLINNPKTERARLFLKRFSDN